MSQMNVVELPLQDSPRSAWRVLPPIIAVERHEIVALWNATEAEYPHDKCLHELFEVQAARTPEAIAVVYDGAQLTYAELNAKANRLAHHLRTLGVQPDARVAICMERSFDMVVGLLAILKAGGAYVPLDPGYPAERLAFMIEDCAPVAVLTHAQARARLPAAFAAALAVIDLADPERWSKQTDSNPDLTSIGLSSRHLAYVIYTSGSTGQPKGVIAEHKGIVNSLTWMQRVYCLSAQDRVLQKTPFGFDPSVREIFLPLLNGATLVMARPEGHKDPEYLAEIISRERITILNFVPSMLRAFLENGAAQKCAELTRVFCAGEVLPTSLARRFHDLLPNVQLHNFYGPTENTQNATVFDWNVGWDTPSGSVPIGRPISNTRMYILDRRGEPVPIGVAGEIYIGGVGVARGYLNRPELTARRFIPSPFVEGDRLYKTGDLGRYLADGNIEFLGRNDFQVKIRGFRIEPGEIEACLTQHPAVREAVVVAREDTPGDQWLVAYYTGRSGRNHDAVRAEALRTHLSAKLPEYMVPAAYVWLQELPLNANGKLDRKALPAPERDAYAARAYEAPQTETEELVAQIWAEVLKLKRVGRQDHFFELGGDSLLAVRVISRLRRQGFHADVRTLFAAPKLAALAATVGDNAATVEVPPNGIPCGCSAITPQMLPLVNLTQGEINCIVDATPGGAGNIQDIYPLAPLQEGILFHHLMVSEGDPYLLQTVLGFDSRARVEAYLDALRGVIDRHDILRTAVLWEGLAEPVQVVWREVPLPVEEVELNPAAGDIAGQMRARFDPRHFRLDVRRAPLMRLFIAHDPEHDRWLMVELLHHLSDDRTTLLAIQQEIQAHLMGQGENLPAPLPFRNFVAQARLGVSREEHEAFFREILGDVEEPTAPFGLTDIHGDGSGICEGRRAIDPALAKRLRARAR